MAFKKIDEGYPQLNKTLLLIFIILLATFLRLYQLDNLPPGFFFDEAFNRLDAVHVAQGTEWHLFYEANFGREPGHIYFTALIYKLLGVSSWSSRFASALIGILTIPLTYQFGREWSRQQFSHNTATYLAALAAVFMALSFWPLALSRIFLRAIYLLPPALLMGYFLLRAYRTGKTSDFVWCGVWCGVAQYTYLSARLLPFVIVLTAVYWAWHDPTRRTPMIKGLLLIGVTCFIVSLPLLWYFYSHLDLVVGRSQDVSIWQLGRRAGLSPYALLAQNGLATIRMFIDQGDSNIRHNLPHLPAVVYAAAVLFFIGLLTTVRYIYKPLHIFALGWLVIMLQATMLSEAPPHFLRAVGALPAIALLIVTGGAQLVTLVERFLPHKSRPVFLLILGVFIAINGGNTFYNYFHRWANDPALFDAFNTGQVAAIENVRELTQTHRVYLVPDLIYNPAAPGIYRLFLAEADVRTFDGFGNCLVYVDQPQQPVAYVVSLLNDRTAVEDIRQIYRESSQGERIRHLPTGDTIFRTLLIEPHTTTQSVDQQNTAVFGEQLQLISYQLPREIKAGDPIPLTLYWQALQKQLPQLIVFVHLYPSGQENSEPAAQTDQEPCYPTWRWQPPEIIRDNKMLLPTTADLPPGSYTAATGVYTWPELTRLTVSPGPNSLDNGRYSLGEIVVTP